MVNRYYEERRINQAKTSTLLRLIVKRFLRRDCPGVRTKDIHIIYRAGNLADSEESINAQGIFSIVPCNDSYRNWCIIVVSFLYCDSSCDRLLYLIMWRIHVKSERKSNGLIQKLPNEECMNNASYTRTIKLHIRGSKTITSLLHSFKV